VSTVKTTRLRYSASITVERNGHEITLNVSATVTDEHKQFYLSDFKTSPILPCDITAQEYDLAESAVIDVARCYPETGQSVDSVNPIDHDDLCGWFRAGRAAAMANRKFELPSGESDARRNAWSDGFRSVRG
jgi:hypothetical protein